jgi:hypothetical protein
VTWLIEREKSPSPVKVCGATVQVPARAWDWVEAPPGGVSFQIWVLPV